MKLKPLSAAVLALAALAAFTASPAMATTLEVGGVAKNESVFTEWSLKEHIVIWRDTSGITANTCTTASLKDSTSSPFTGTTVGGPVSTMSFSNCTEGTPVVDAAGTLSIENISGTTNGTVRSNGAKTTIPSFFGTLTCTTSNTDLGTIVGVKSGNATVNAKGVLSCTVLGSVITEAVYVLTSPTGFGVGA